MKTIDADDTTIRVGKDDTIAPSVVEDASITGVNMRDGGSANDSALMAVATMSVATILAGAAIFAKRK
ncbi:hypothetical protein IKF02_03040 [Candidatus Saccharibacteria bacterium]|nr:hypothetical protein [Candidatus Saccharibacteria bacterium]MBR3143632.1 hypothetical protein [Candidatus Saccharibacteria bacterium]